MMTPLTEDQIRDGLSQIPNISRLRTLPVDTARELLGTFICLAGKMNLPLAQEIDKRIDAAGKLQSRDARAELDRLQTEIFQKAARDVDADLERIQKGESVVVLAGHENRFIPVALDIAHRDRDAVLPPEQRHGITLLRTYARATKSARPSAALTRA